MCARIINPYNLDDDDDAIFAGALSSGLIWIEDDDDDDDDDEGESLEYIADWYKKARELVGQQGDINDIAVNGDYVISVSSDQTSCVWNWKTGKLIHTMTHKNPVFGIIIKDECVIASSREEISVWNWKTGKLLYTFSEQNLFVGLLASDGDILAIASEGDIQIWNWRTGKLLNTVTGRHPDIIEAIAVKGNFILSYSIGKLLVRNWENNKVIHRIGDSSTYYDYEEIILLKEDFVIFANHGGISDIWNWETGEYLSPNHTDKRVFVHPTGIYIYNPSKNWQFYHWGSEYWDIENTRLFTLTEDYAYIIMYDGKLNVYKTNLPLNNRQNQISNMSSIAPYNIDDVIKTAIAFIRKRNGQWVNFSRLSHHLHEVFTDLNPKNLGKPSKNYKSLLKLIADYPNHFELRPDTTKQGLFWIRLK